MLCVLVCEQMTVQQLDLSASFFDLGGSSLDVVSLLSTIKAKLGAVVSLRQFHDASTASQFALAVTAACRSVSKRTSAIRSPLPRTAALPM